MNVQLSKVGSWTSGGAGGAWARSLPRSAIVMHQCGGTLAPMVFKSLTSIPA